jgi:hypothetical protein
MLSQALMDAEPEAQVTLAFRRSPAPSMYSVMSIHACIRCSAIAFSPVIVIA